MNELLELNLEFEAQRFRVVGPPDKPEWVAADVCDALGIGEPANALRRFEEDERGMCSIHTPQGGSQEMLTVTEPGLYRLISRSRKTDAKRFQRWVFHEVLPCIRQHGCYPAPEVALWDHRAIVKIDASALVPIIQPLVDGQFALQVGQKQLQETVGELVDGQKKLAGDMGDLSSRLDKFDARRDLNPRDKRRHTDVVWKKFGGKCPCCHEITIVSNDGERNERAQFDHWGRVSENGIEATWLLCDGCNLRLCSRDVRRNAEHRFKAYQEVRGEHEARKQKRFPGL